jgi:hypothetical protein
MSLQKANEILARRARPFRLTSVRTTTLMPDSEFRSVSGRTELEALLEFAFAVAVRTAVGATAAFQTNLRGLNAWGVLSYAATPPAGPSITEVRMDVEFAYPDRTTLQYSVVATRYGQNGLTVDIGVRNALVTREDGVLRSGNPVVISIGRPAGAAAGVNQAPGSAPRTPSRPAPAIAPRGGRR